MSYTCGCPYLSNHIVDHRGSSWNPKDDWRFTTFLQILPDLHRKLKIEENTCGGFLKWGYLQIIRCHRMFKIFSMINHPFWGSPPFVETQWNPQNLAQNFWGIQLGHGENHRKLGENLQISGGFHGTINQSSTNGTFFHCCLWLPAWAHFIWPQATASHPL